MIRRLLVLGILLLAAWWWLRRLLAAGARQEVGRGGSAAGPMGAGEMVRDRVCNTFIPKAGALTLREGGEEHHFCSENCRRKWIAERTASPA